MVNRSRYHNNIKMEFRTDVRNLETQGKIILKYSPEGNYIITNGWLENFFKR